MACEKREERFVQIGELGEDLGIQEKSVVDPEVY